VELRFLSDSEEKTKSLGRALARLLKPGDLILLYGDLGSGKTVLVKGICEGLEVDPDVYITSPTFSLVNIYEGKYTIFHVDLYRLETEDVYELGIWEYLTEGIVIIEWAERLDEIPTEDFLEVYIEYIDEAKRLFKIFGYGQLRELLKALDVDDLSKD